MSNIDFLFTQLDFCEFCPQQRDAVGENDQLKHVILKKKIREKNYFRYYSQCGQVGYQVAKTGYLGTVCGYLESHLATGYFFGYF